MIWHSADYSDVLNCLSADSQTGFVNGVADSLLDKYGKNTITSAEKPSFSKYFIKVIRSKLIISLCIVALLSFVLSMLYDNDNGFSSLLIIGVIFLNSILSAYQFYNSELILNSLHNRTSPTTTVIREGIEQNISSDLLVPGDIILLAEGDYISADARLIETFEFRCNETSLTGETVPVEKNADTILEDITPVEKRSNMVFCGTNVIHGTAKAVVTNTGIHTEMGRSSTITQQVGNEKLPLQNSLDRSQKILNLVILLICILYFIIGILRNFEAGQFASMTVNKLMDSLALGVATIPESLPMVSAIVIALGIERIVKDKIIIKKTKAVELLGRASVICVDKTGILTHDSMSLTAIFDGNNTVNPQTEKLSEKNSLVLKLAAVCSTLDNDSTERTIINACTEYNNMSQFDIENTFPRLAEIPFDSVRKCMTTINMINGQPFSIVKGAPEILIDKCIGCDKEKLIEVNNNLANEGLRVICIAMRPLEEIPANPHYDDIEKDLIFVGLLGLFDPPRNQAISGINMCDNAGIKTIMITGDSPITARAVARRIGVLKNGTELLTGDELKQIDDEQLAENIEKYTVFARVSPSDKVRIIKAWQTKGGIVAATGDGVEDADALAVADIGCAVGKFGTDVAKGSADTVITNNSFLSVVSAIKESRGLFENIRKSVYYLMSCNFGELIAFFVGIVFFGIVPLNAVQLLCINLITDSAPSIALSFEKAEDAVMNKRSYSLSGKLFSLKAIIGGIAESLFIALVTLIAYFIGTDFGVVHSNTMAFTTLGMIQIFHSYNLKYSNSIFLNLKNLFSSNKFMTASNGLALFSILFMSFTPVGFIFGMSILSMKRFIICLLLALSIIPYCEIIKIIKNKK